MSKAIPQVFSLSAIFCSLLMLLAFNATIRLSAPEFPPADASHVAEWIACLQNKDPDIRERARCNLHRIGEPAIPHLMAILDRKEPLAEPEARRLLLCIRSHAVVPALIRMAQSGEPRVRREAIEALGCIGPGANAAVPALLELVRNKQTYQIEKLGGQCFIPITLARILGAKAVPLLIEMLADPELRFEAVEALGEKRLGLASLSALPSMDQAAQAESPAIRSLILNTMELIRLRGTWVLTGIEEKWHWTTVNVTAGTPHTGWVISGNQWSKGSVATGYLRIDPERDPKTMILTESSPFAPAVRTHYLIYECDGQTLKTYGGEESEEPSEIPHNFPSIRRSSVPIYHWRRVESGRHDVRI
jgi:hypothetical protein